MIELLFAGYLFMRTETGHSEWLITEPRFETRQDCREYMQSQAAHPIVMILCKPHTIISEEERKDG